MMMRLLGTLLMCALVLPNSGCAAVIAASAIRNHQDRKWQEMEYRHKERMRELDLQERQLKQNLPPQPSSAIVRDNPY